MAGQPYWFGSWMTVLSESWLGSAVNRTIYAGAILFRSAKKAIKRDTEVLVGITQLQ